VTNPSIWSCVSLGFRSGVFLRLFIMASR
jgi:hypothetical protein